MGTFNRPRRGGRGGSGQGESGGGIRPVFGRSAEDEGWGEKPDYKTAALCKQVRRAVSLTLSGECGDPVLQALLVDEVLPAPNAGRMLVRVMVRAREQEAAGETLADILQRLAKVEGMLRARVGEMIARKRVPELVFEVIPVGAVRAESQNGEVSDG